MLDFTLLSYTEIKIYKTYKAGEKKKKRKESSQLFWQEQC